MVTLQKALVFGAAVWFSIAIIGGMLRWQQFMQIPDTGLLMIPVSVIITIIAALEYLKEIHAQYEVEGLELASVWFLESLALEILVFSIFYGRGVDHFLDISTWLMSAFKFVFPLAAGMYMQHTMTE
ncbi:MAG: hypothetical protein ABIG96_01260 [Candidatus Micrarchaeota archaeon]